MRPRANEAKKLAKLTKKSQLIDFRLTSTTSHLTQYFQSWKNGLVRVFRILYFQTRPDFGPIPNNCGGNAHINVHICLWSSCKVNIFPVSNLAPSRLWTCISKKMLYNRNYTLVVPSTLQRSIKLCCYRSQRAHSNPIIPPSLFSFHWKSNRNLIDAVLIEYGRLWKIYKLEKLIAMFTVCF